MTLSIYQLQKAEGEGNCLGYAAKDGSSGLVPWKFDRRSLRDDDVKLKVTYAGVCHSDVHQVKDDWGNATCATPVLCCLQVRLVCSGLCCLAHQAVWTHVLNAYAGVRCGH